MENMLASQAQFDNEIRAERCTSGIKEAVRQGRYVWHAPVGYINLRVNNKATIGQGPLAELVHEAFLEVATNTTDTETIRSMFIAKGLYTTAVKGISANQFQLMLRNPLYKGVIQKFGMSVKGSFEPIVSEELFNHVQAVLQKRGYKKWITRSNNPHFPLRKFVFHPTGVKLTGGWAQGRNKKYAYYFFKNMKGSIYAKDHFENLFCQFLKQFSITEEKQSRFRAFIEEQFFPESKDAQVITNRLETQLADIESREQKVIQKNLAGVFNDVITKKELEVLADQKLSLNAQLAQAQIKEQSISLTDCLPVAWKYMVEPDNAWKQCSSIFKSTVQRFYFPQGILYDGKEIQTIESSIFLKANSAFLEIDSYKVRSGFQNSNTLDIGKLPYRSKKPLFNKIEIDKYLQEIQMLNVILTKDNKPIDNI